jgi:hypothetical protein
VWGPMFQACVAVFPLDRQDTSLKLPPRSMISIQYPAKCMKPIFVAALLIFLMCGSVFPQQDAFEKCRLVTPSDLSDKGAPTFAAYRDNIRGMSGHPKLDLSNPTARYYRTWFGAKLRKGRIMPDITGSSCGAVELLVLCSRSST